MAKSTVVNFNLKPHMVEKLVKQLAIDSCNIAYVKHAEEQMNLRDITYLQVQNCLKRGKFVEGPAIELSHDNWQFKVEGHAGGDSLAVVAALENVGEGDYILVITAFQYR